MIKLIARSPPLTGIVPAFEFPWNWHFLFPTHMKRRCKTKRFKKSEYFLYVCWTALLQANNLNDHTKTKSNSSCTKNSQSNKSIIVAISKQTSMPTSGRSAFAEWNCTKSQSDYHLYLIWHSTIIIASHRTPSSLMEWAIKCWPWKFIPTSLLPVVDARWQKVYVSVLIVMFALRWKFSPPLQH